MFILLPPSEGKSDLIGKPPNGGAAAGLNAAMTAESNEVRRHLESLDAEARASFYGLRARPAKAEEIHTLNRESAWPFLDDPAQSAGLKAISRYTGVVYSHIDYPTLSDRRQAEKRLLIVSGLWGLIAAGTPIPNYKLPINPWTARYWRTINGERLMKTAKGKPVLDLLPAAYAKALDYPELIRVEFKTAGGKKQAGHFGKAIKGKFVRFLLENKIDSPERFGEFTEDGYRFDGKDFIQQ